MIKLKKGQEPQVLKDNSSTWTKELLAAIAANDKDEIKRKTKRYNHPEVKSALKQETKEKCAYCEAKVTAVAHGDIEHVTPKSIDRSLTFLWENLTFACQICNQKKSAKEDILDPYSDQPDDHLFFAGAFVKGRTPEGTRTVLELDLNRAPLLESRNREIERYAGEVEKVFLVQDVELKRLLFDSLIAELESGEPEHIAACRVVLETYGKQLAA
ncbi:HNH endonuclease [Pseudaestuariivita sp.]|uniref:HNH endonuclease n=1 Tax=Pseudaestuariivita sp. TaxID=2211669 RepID=UPI004058360D